jgi:hypothetical protein
MCFFWTVMEGKIIESEAFPAAFLDKPHCLLLAIEKGTKTSPENLFQVNKEV